MKQTTSFKNAFSIVTRRFKLAAPIKNSQYHKEWSELIAKAKKLKQIDTSQMDLEKINSSRLIGLFGRIQDKLDEGYEAGVEPEVLAFSQISDILNITQQTLLRSRQERNNILEGPLSAEAKRELIDILIKEENRTLKITIDTLADMDIDSNSIH